MTHVYVNGWTDRGSGYKDGLFRSSGEHEKSISLYFTDCFVRAVPVCVSRLPPVSFYRYGLQYIVYWFIPARIIPVLNPSMFGCRRCEPSSQRSDVVVTGDS